MKTTEEKKHKLHVKTGDTVKVIAGNDRGKIGKVVSVKTDSIDMQLNSQICHHLQ